MIVLVDTRVLPGFWRNLNWFAMGLPLTLCHEGGHLAAALFFRRRVRAFVVHRRRSGVIVVRYTTDRRRPLLDRLVYAAGPAGGSVYAAALTAALRAGGGFPEWPFWAAWLFSTVALEMGNLIPSRHADGTCTDAYGVIWGRPERGGGGRT